LARNDEMSVTVTVIVPTRDRPGLLREALRSVASQSFGDWECIVVDDGSALPPVVPRDPRFSVVRATASGGPGAARNVGIERARGRFVAFLDDDDEFVESALGRLLEQAAEGSVAVGGIAFVDGLPHPSSATRWHGDLGGSVVDDPPHLGQGLYPRATIERFDPAFRTGQDVEWWLRTGLRHAFRSVDGVTYLFRQHDGARPGASRSVRMQNRQRLLIKHAEWFEAHPESYAIQLARCSSAALVASRPRKAAAFAARSLRTRPSRLAAKLLVSSTFSALVHEVIAGGAIPPI
jgi:glycosyltransferase involved in cell wall biosynthesis